MSALYLPKELIKMLDVVEGDTTEKKVIKNHVFLRLKNINNTVDMFYSLDGEKWRKIENSIEVTGYNHNVFGGFLSLRLGLCSMGDGKVKFRNFKYEPIK